MIISAACRGYVNGEYNIFPVMRHGDFFRWMKILHCQYDKNEIEQGFIVWDENQRIERFVSRQEAAKIAIENNQILPNMKESFNPNCLYSEDIY